MVYSIQALVIFSTAQRRNQAQSAVESERVAQRWGVDTVEAVAGVYGSALPSLSVQIRFISQADAQGAYTRLESAFDSRVPEPGSRLSLHNCTHDENTNVCVVVQQRVW